jgi:hypothetical protein
MEGLMTVRTRTRLAPNRSGIAGEPLLRSAVVVPAETVALIARRNARRIESLVQEAGAWILLAGFWAVSLLVVAVAIGFV